MKVGILGAGSWGTALASVIAKKNINTRIWSRQKEDVELINNSHTNPRYLPDVTLPNQLIASTDMKEVISGCEVLIIAVPSQSVGEVLETAKEYIDDDVIIVNVAKGIELGSLRLMSEVVKHHCPENSFVSLSGPSHAEEVAKNQLTTLVAASEQIQKAQIIQDLFSADYLRVYTNKDLRGVELGGSLKNIIALGAGISDGLGNGDNAKAALMTRGLHEIARLGKKMGANASTFAGLTGIGDLVVTCTSMHSRNRRCGIYIGQGMSIAQAVEKVGMVVEGIHTVKSAYDLSKKHGVDMPITEYMYKVVYEDLSPKDAVEILMSRSKKHEIEDIK